MLPFLDLSRKGRPNAETFFTFEVEQPERNIVGNRHLLHVVCIARPSVAVPISRSLVFDQKHA